MTVHTDDAVISRIAALPSVRGAAQAGARLIALWPLTDAKQMDNDAKYAENLQVRLTRMIARVTTGEDVSVPDAEFVYEGADEIPGRPQTIVRALIAANDAYDEMAGIGGVDDMATLARVADLLGAGWDDTVRDAVEQSVKQVTALLDGAGGTDGTDGADAGAGEGVADSDDTGTAGDDDADAVDALAVRLATALAICDGLFETVGKAMAARGADAHAQAVATLPVLLFVNELREWIGVPRICLSAREYRGLCEARAGAGAGDTVEAVARVIAPLAEAEWTRHHDDVMWDPDEAKRLAKEEDERKNKEALAAKFAHIKDDPTKPEVEL